MNFWQQWNKKEQRIPLWMIGVIIGVLFLLIGYQDGQLTEMYRKAVMICLECIGIG